MVNAQCLNCNWLNYLSVPLFHGPHADHYPAANSYYSSEFLQGSNSSLGSRDVMNDGHWQNGVDAVVAERQRQIITEHHLQK